MTSVAVGCAITLLFWIPAFALDPSRAITQYGHDIWQVEEGLPNSAVYSIAQTKDGFLWLGTQEGLAQFDGVRFRVFDKGNTREIQDWIWALEADPDGSLWIGTFAGLVHQRNQRFTLYTRANGLVGDHISALCLDRSGTLWIGTPEGLSRFRNGQFENFTTAHGLADNAVVALEEDQQGRIWIGTSKGLNTFKDGKIITYTAKDGLADNAIISLHATRDGILWIGTNGGLTRYQNGTFVSYTVKDGLSSNIIDCLLQDQNGNLWIGTYGEGINRFNKQGLAGYSVPQGLSAKIVRCFYEDTEGNLWIGTDGGLERLKDTLLTTFSAQEGIPSDVVHTIMEDSHRQLWIGTEGGLCRLEQGIVTTFQNTTGISADPVYSLATDRSGRLWIGMQNGGVSVYQNGKFKNFSQEHGLLEGSVYSIYEDRQGNMLFGPFRGGLNLFRDGKFTVYKSREEVPKTVLVLYQDRAAILWVGTNGGGLLRFDPDGERKIYTKADGLSSNMIYALHEDSNGNLWIGTAGGLTLFHRNRWIEIDPRGGLPDTVIYSIQEDAEDHLWMSCNKGIFRVSRTQLLDYALDKIEQIDPTLFAKDDGMKTRECAGGTQPAAWKAAGGHLWFATTRGAVRVDPSNLSSQSKLPPVVLEEVVADRNSTNLLANPAAAMTFPPGSGDLEFHYTALTLKQPGKVRFRYRLEGFDAEWIDAGHRRIAYYTNIPPGRYRFRVIAANDDGVWNENGAELGVSLQPRFYQTGYFYGLCAVAFGFGIWALYRLRVGQIQARFHAVLEERSRISRELHDSVSQGLTGVSLQLEAILRNPQSAALSTQLNSATEMVRMTQAESRRLIQDLRPAILQNGDLKSALLKTGNQMTAGTGIQFNIVVRGVPFRVPGFVEDNLFRVAQESIANVMKHANARSILIDLGYETRQIRLRITDDGCGFVVAEHSGHGQFGLLGMRERARDISGSLNIESGPQKGTTIEIVVPV